MTDQAQRAQVVVVGAGPAGAVTALSLARDGVDVCLVDAERFPRDKVCGDALIPDSHEVFVRLGLLERVAEVSHPVAAIRVTAPGGDSVRLEVPLMTAPRLRLDAVLVEAAIEAGAQMLSPLSVREPIRDEDGAVCGIVGVDEGGRQRTVHAPVTVLATGAASRVLDAFGVCVRTTPSALALRGYYRFEELDESELIISYEKPVMPGYGWIFPTGNGEANVGVGVFLENGRPPENLRTVFSRFTSECPFIQRLMERATPLGRLEGAPLRCSLEGAAPVADGLLVAGEALGTTYALSGEGIGKAMESGLFAASAATSAVRQGRFDSDALRSYQSALAAAEFPARFEQYRAAQKWLRHTFVVNLLAKRARQSERLRSVLEQILREELPPSEVLSAKGVFRMLLPL